MATDKKGRKLPKGIRQRYDEYEGRFMHEGQEYLVHGATITETQKLMEDLRYKVRHGIIASSHKVIFSEWITRKSKPRKALAMFIKICITCI